MFAHMRQRNWEMLFCGTEQNLYGIFRKMLKRGRGILNPTIDRYM